MASKMLFKLWMYALLTLFSLEGVTWNTPTNISDNTDNLNVASPQIVLDSDGNATAVWVDTSQGLMWASLPFGGSWSPPAIVSANVDIREPKLAVDGSGNVAAIWVVADFYAPFHLLAGEIQASINSGGVWSAPITISLDPYNTDPQIVADTAGNLTAAWTAFTLAPTTPYTPTPYLTIVGREVHAARYSGSWGAPYVLDTSAVFPVLSVAANGNVVCAWAKNNGRMSFLLVTSSFSDGGWSSLVTLGELESPFFDNEYTYALGAYGDGNAVAVWVDGNNRIVSRRRLSGGTWSTLTTLDTTVASSTQVFLAVNASGDAMALWSPPTGVTPTTTTGDIKVSWASLTNGNWSTATPFGRNPDFPQLVIAPSGYAVLIGIDDVLGVERMSTYNRGLLTMGVLAPWQNTVITTGATGGFDFPQIALIDTGYAVAVWCNVATGFIQAAISSIPTTATITGLVPYYGPAAGGNVIKINGTSTDAFSVTFGEEDAISFVQVATLGPGTKSINAKVPAGTPGSEVQVVVTSY